MVCRNPRRCGHLLKAWEKKLHVEPMVREDVRGQLLLSGKMRAMVRIRIPTTTGLQGLVDVTIN